MCKKQAPDRRLDSIPADPRSRLPREIGILQGPTIVQTSDAHPLVFTHDFIHDFTHDFTNGFANPLISRHPMGSLIAGGSRC